MPYSINGKEVPLQNLVHDPREEALTSSQSVSMTVTGLTTDEYEMNFKKKKKKWHPIDKKGWISLKQLPLLFSGYGQYACVTKKDLFVFSVLLSLVKDGDARVLTDRKRILAECKKLAKMSKAVLSVSLRHLKTAEMISIDDDGFIVVNANIAGRGKFEDLHYNGYLEP